MAEKLWMDMRGYAAAMGVSVQTVRRWISQGRIPRPTRLGHRIHRWRVEVISKHLIFGPQEKGTYANH